MSDLNPEALVKTLVSLALGDGKLDPSERSLITRVCRGAGIPLADIARWGDETVRKGPSATMHLPRNPADQEAFLRRIIQAMLADGEINKSEIDYCLTVARRLGVSAGKMRAMVKEEISGAPAGGPVTGPPLQLESPAQLFWRGHRNAIMGAGVALAAWAFWGFWLSEYMAYRGAASGKDPASCEAYLTRHPSGRYRPQILALKENRAFEAAAQLNTAPTFESFAAEWPAGAHAGEAKKLAADLRYQVLEKSPSTERMEEFLLRCPDDARAGQVRARLEAALYAAASGARDPSLVDGYLAKFPKGARAAEMEALRETLAFEAAMRSPSIDAFEGFLKKFPQSGYTSRAAAQVEYLLYREVFGSRDLKRIDEFFAQYPESRYKASLNKLVAEIWDDIAADPKTIDEEVLGAYLAKYPKGPSVKEARKKLDFRAYRQVEDSKDLSEINQFLAENPGNYFASVARKARRELWDDIIFRYSDKTGNSPDQPAVRFFKSALNHVKVTGNHTVNVRFRRRLEVYDWMDFPEHVRSTIDNAYRKDSQAAPGSTNMESLREALSNDNLGSLERGISDSIEEAMIGMFGKGVFAFNTISGQSRASEGISFDINYTIRNMYEKRIYPVCYERTRLTTDSRTGVETDARQFMGYMLGFEIVWDMGLTIPGSVRRHRIQDVSKPANDFQKTAGSADDAYMEMTRQAFQKFGSKIASHFGL